MAYKSEGECPIAVSNFIKRQSEKLGVSLNTMIKKYSTEAEVPIKTIENWIWPKKPSTLKIEGDDKPLKKITKSETKIS